MGMNPIKTSGGQGRFVSVLGSLAEGLVGWESETQRNVTTVRIVADGWEASVGRLPRAGPIWRTVATGCLRERQG